MATVSNAAVGGAVGGAAAFAHVWRANQLASYRSTAVPSGYAELDRELADGGWPSGVLIELLLQQPGIGEMQLLQPALRQTGPRTIVLVQPPHPPQAAAWAADNFPVERLLWVKSKRSADALWAAEQILRNQSCAALMLWQSHVRNESLRRLQLAAQAGDTVFWLLRPLAAAQDASPAPLRLALRPAAAGIRIDIVKRRGPRRDQPLIVPLGHMPAADVHCESDHAPVDKRASAVVTPRNSMASLI